MITVRQLINYLLDCNMDAFVLYKEGNEEIYPMDIYGFGGGEDVDQKTCASIVFHANQEDIKELNLLDEKEKNKTPEETCMEVLEKLKNDKCNSQ